MNITPDQAASLAENYVEPWEIPDCPDAVELWESAYDLAQTIAGMTEEWGVEYLGHVSQWGSRESAEDELGYYLRTGVFIPRLVRRLVGPVEEAE